MGLPSPPHTPIPRTFKEKKRRRCRVGVGVGVDWGDTGEEGWQGGGGEIENEKEN